jgi:hypothetical protein
MPRKAVPVEGVYEREEGSGLWYARFRVNGKLVRKSFGRNRPGAVRYVEKARTLGRLHLWNCEYGIDDVVAAFQRLRDLGLKRREGRTHPTPEDSVFAIGDNKKRWVQAMSDANIENFRWHDLRHTFCSRLAQSGVGLKVIQEAAGHKKISMRNSVATDR